MRDPEEMLREGLGHLADEVGTGVPLAQRARAGRRRRTRRMVGVATAAAVLVAVGGVGAALHGSGSSAAPSVGTPTDVPTQHSVLAPDGYRLEVWQDVGVYVPVGWGWGGAPGACGVGPTVGADGHRLTATERTDGVLPGYVGRPVAQTPRCPRSATQGISSAMPFVWLGAKDAPAEANLGHGFVVQTQKYGDTTVTVGSSDARLRRTILASAHWMTGGACADWLGSPPMSGEQPSVGAAGPVVPDAMTVCAYAPAAMSGYQLLYQEQLAEGPAKQLVDAVADAKPMGEFSCFGASGGEWVLLHLATADGSRDYVVDLSCPSIADPSGLQHELISADVLPWAVDGVNAVLHSSPLIDVPGRLIGQ